MDQENVMLVGVAVITSRSETTTLSPDFALGALGKTASLTVTAEACGPDSARAEATPIPRAAEPVKNDRRVIGELIVSLIPMKLSYLSTVCISDSKQVTYFSRV